MGSISGTVTDQAGQPVAGAVVRAIPAAGVAEIVSQPTGNDGVYAIPNAPDGAYTVRVDRPAGYTDLPVDVAGAAVAGVDFAPAALPWTVPHSTWGRASLWLVALSAVAAVGWVAWSFTWESTDSKVWSWLLCLLILGAFTVGVGHALTGYWKSILIDHRNKASLSRLQMALWTGLVLSAYATAVAWNRQAGSPDPLEVPIPQELWILMGIATASVAGAVLIKEDQSKKTSIELDTASEALPPSLAAKSEATKKALEDQGQAAEGKLAINKEAKAARWTDMLKGETLDHFAYLDLGKVQMFFFTVILVTLYALAIGDRFDHAECYSGQHEAAAPPQAGTVEGEAVPDSCYALQESDAGGTDEGAADEAAEAADEKDEFQFPGITEAMVVLLGISHAGYLTLKAAK